MKLIAIDLDGTLLNHDHEISEENIQAIRYAESKGLEVSIATGRAHSDVLSILKKANLNTHIISNNGSSIHLKTGEKLGSIAISKKDIAPVLSWLEENNYHYEVANDTEIFSYAKGFKNLEDEIEMLKTSGNTVNFKDIEYMYNILQSQKGVIKVNSYEEILNQCDEFYNIMVLCFIEEKRLRGKEHFMNNENLYVFSSFMNNFEMVHKDSSKGNALELLADKLNIDLKDAMAIGDNYNDVTMLSKVGLSVAMGNAEEEIKKLCDFTTLLNTENGVAHAIMTKLFKAS